MFELNEDDLEDGMDLPTGNKSPFQQITLTVATAQAEFMYQAMADVMKTDEYKYMVTHGNLNSNGNAAALIFEQWAQQKK